jgi:hypothetical protein
MARLVFFTRTTWARIVTANFAIARLSSDSGCGFAVIGLVAQLLHLRQTLSFFAALLFLSTRGLMPSPSRNSLWRSAKIWRKRKGLPTAIA